MLVCEHGKQLRNDTEEFLFASTVHIPATTHPTPQPGNRTVGVVGCSGGHSGGETPGPIPNPEAKPSSADGTATDRSWESRTPPEHPTTPTHILHPTKRGEDSHQEPRPFFARPTPDDSRPLLEGHRRQDEERRRRRPSVALASKNGSDWSTWAEAPADPETQTAPNGATGLRRASSIPGRQPCSTSDRRVGDVHASACASPWGGRRPPPPGCLLQRPSRDAHDGCGVVQSSWSAGVGDPPVATSRPVPRRRVSAPPGRGRCHLGTSSVGSGATPVEGLRTSLRSAQPWGTRPGGAEAAGAEVEPGEVALDVDVQPFAPRRAGAIRGRAHEGGAETTTPVVRCDREVEQEGVVAAVPRDVGEREAFAVPTAEAQPSEGARTRSHRPARASPPPARGERHEFLRR